MNNQLLRDLDELVSRSIITSESAAEISRYYDAKKSSQSGKLTLILAVMGGILLGSGVILVLAHNWEFINRGVKTLIAILPLLVGQVLCLLALMKHRENRSWMEVTAILLFFGIAATISLISQIYQISGELGDFLLTWMVLALPIVYITGSSAVSLFIIALATWFVFEKQEYEMGNRLPYPYFLILLCLIPKYLTLLRNVGSSKNSFYLHNWFFVLSTMLALGAFIPSGYNEFAWVCSAYISLAGLFYLVGKRELFNETRLFLNPFRLVSLPVMVGVLCFWTFAEFWREAAGRPGIGQLLRESFTYLCLLIVLIYLIVLLKNILRTLKTGIDLVTLTPLIFLVCVLLLRHAPFMGIFIFNIWILVTGVIYIYRGTSRDHLGYLNLGLLILATLALIRFFDTNIPFMWRGLMFIASGAGFFILNSMMIRRRKKIIEKSAL
ncbi:MAG TPA: DUF2157 domain-containing protein [Flavitalea sp.]|nr:DUF2157 domain-containing protein [Flavitalea sp.]